MIDQTTPVGRIEVEPVRSLLRNKYRFVAFDGAGDVIVAGDSFTSNPILFAEGPPGHKALRRLIRELEVFGWEAVPASGKWYAHRIYPSTVRALLTE